MESWSIQQTKRWIEEHYGQDVGEKFEGEYFTLAIAFSCEYSAYGYIGASPKHAKFLYTVYIINRIRN